MKKLGFGLLLIIGSFGSLKAQDNYPAKGDVSVLAKIGANGAVYAGDDVDDENLERVPAILLGANVDYYFSSSWSLRSGLLYEQRKFKSTLTDVVRKASYLTVPVTANLHVGRKKRWNINLGPSLAFNLSSEIDGADTKNDTKVLDPGAELGTGFQVPLNSSSLYFEVSSFIGFTNPETDNDANAQWTRVSINIGLMF